MHNTGHEKEQTNFEGDDLPPFTSSVGALGPFSGAPSPDAADHGIRPENEVSRLSQTTPDAKSSGPNVDQPLPLGTRFIGELPVPESLQYDHAFLSLPRDAQKYILENVQKGAVVFQRPPVVSRTEKHTVRLRMGQWSRLKEIISRADKFEEDRRRSLTENSLLRELLDVSFTFLVPHLDLRGVATEEQLQRAVVQAFRKAATTTQIA